MESVIGSLAKRSNPMPKNTRLCVYAGSFDPLTVGHLWMIEQGALLFERLIVAIGVNPEKRYTFTLEDRLTMLRECPWHRSQAPISLIMPSPLEQATSCGAFAPRATMNTSER